MRMFYAINTTHRIAQCALLLLYSAAMLAACAAQTLVSTCPATTTVPATSVSSSSISFALNGAARTNEFSREIGWIGTTGDVNDDGIPDLITTDRSGAGMVIIIYGTTTQPTTRLAQSPYMTDYIANTRQGFKITGHSSSCIIGYAAFVGDFNGDHVGDIAVGCSTNSKVYIVFGESGAIRLADVSLTASPATSVTFLIDLSATDSTYRFGWTIAGGDINDDSISDLIIGAPRAPAPTTEDYAGLVYVIYGTNSSAAPRASITSSAAIVPPVGYKITAPSRALDRLGKVIAFLGDVNGDSVSDFAVSVYNNGKGLTWVIYGAAGTSRATLSLTSLATTDGYKIDGSSVPASPSPVQTGTSLSSAGDFDGDGTNDILVGYFSGDAAMGYGGAYVIYGVTGTSTSTVDLSTLAASTGFKFGSSTYYGTGAGMAIFGSPALDFDNDGYDDIVLGAPLDIYDVKGSVQVLYGFNTRSTASITHVDTSITAEGAGFVLLGRNDYEGLGSSVSAYLVGATAYIVAGCAAKNLQAGGVVWHQICTPDLQCPAGMFVDPANSLSACLTCPAGTYSLANNNQTSCTNCPAGKFSMTAGATSSANCIMCPPGTYSLAGASSFLYCIKCPAGYYNGLPGQSACTPCPAATFVPTTGSYFVTQCQPCPIGWMAKNPAVTGAALQGAACTPCTPGTYSDTTGAMSCTPCPVGTYSNLYMATSVSRCTSCPLGKWTGITGATLSSQCINCPAGTQALEAGNCTQCPPGKYTQSSGAFSCVICGQGSSCPLVFSVPDSACDP